MITKISILLKFLNKKTIRVISSLVIALGMVFSSMPFVDFIIHASDATYVNVPYGTNDNLMFSYNNVNFICSNNNTNNDNNNDVRGLIIVRGTSLYCWLVSENPFTYFTGASDGNNTLYRASSYTVNGITYYSNRTRLLSYHTSGVIYHFPVVTVDTYNGITDAVYYTFGDGAIDPTPETEYGTLKDLTFSSSIVGSGNGTGEANIDTIKWYPFADSNNKMFGTGGSVEIRVVPGDYISGTQEGIFTQTYSDFVLDVAHAGHLATVPAYNGTYSVNWGTVMQKLSASWPALELLWDGEYWKKLGWVYQVRYQFEEDENTDNWSEWQTVYTMTSSTPSGTEGLDPTDGTAMPGFYENVVDAFNTTSVVNNNTNQTYYVNNIQYIVNESPDEPSSDVTNDLLRDIRNITIQIRQLIVDQNNDGDERDPEDTGLKDKDDELHDREQELIDDMDDKLQDIDTDVELISNSGFLSAANWVRLQYDHLTLNTPFELIIVFALVLGIALIFIGKVR